MFKGYIILNCQLKLTLSLILLGTLLGCSIPHRDKLDPNNYRKNLEIEKSNYDYFSAKYVGGKTGCFPPITKRLCSKHPKLQFDNSYKTIKRLEIEGFKISIKTHDLLKSETLNELIFLTTAELALQRGFPYFTQLNKIEIIACVSSYSADSYGSLSTNSLHNGGSTYSGTTNINRNKTCTENLSGNFIFFRNLSDLKEGVFYKPINSNLKIMPVLKLYFGTTPNISNKEVNSHNSKKNAEIETYYTRTNIKEAWKTIYDAKGLSVDLRKKHQINSSKPYNFKERGKYSEIKKNSVINQNKILIE